MRGFLGTEAPLGSDLSLAITLILGLMAVYGAIRARQKRFTRHCPVMAAGMLANWVPILLLMIPRWLGIVRGTETLATGPFATVPVFHGVLGGVTQLLMTYTVTRMYWVETLPPGKPIWLMRATLILWLLTIIGGVTVYVVSYVV